MRGDSRARRIGGFVASIIFGITSLAGAQTWTAPRTWVTGELVTAAMLNQQIRDNELAILSTTGLLSLTSFGTHSITAGGTGGNMLALRNTTAGTGNFAQFRIGNDASVTTGVISALSSTFTPGTYNLADGVAFSALGAGGLSIAVQHATADIRFYSGATPTLRGTIFETGGYQWGSGTQTDPGADNFRVMGTTTLVGAMTVGATTLKAHASGGVSVGDATDPGSTNFRVAGTTTLVGTTNATTLTATGTVTLGAAAASNIRFVGHVSNTDGLVYHSDTGGSFLSLVTSALGTGAVPGTSLSIGANSSGSHAAGSIAFSTRAFATNWIWVDNSATPGMLRISAVGPPGEDNITYSDTSGTVVGTQASSLDKKFLLAGDLSPRDALAVMLKTPVRHFIYKGGSYNGTTFQGIIADWSPEFAMDPETAHPNGRSFNPVNALGYTVQAIKALKADIDHANAAPWQRVTF